MIHINHRRFGLIVIAATVNDLYDITMAWGLTEQSATRRLLRGLR